MFQSFAFAVCLLSAMLLTACAPKTSPAQFYRLEPLDGAPVRGDNRISAQVIGLGPVRIPAYLDRPQMVTGATGNRMSLDEFHRWAEPLRDSLGLVLSESLAARLPGTQFLVFPWNRALTPDYQIEIDVRRFHVNAEGIAELRANWSILRNNKPLRLDTSHIAFPAAGSDADARVAAQNRTLAQFSQELAEALRALPPE